MEIEKNTGVDCCDYLHIHEDVVNDIKNNMPSENLMEATTELFKALSDYSRMRILCAIAQHEICVCDIANILGMTQSAVSHQLKILKNVRLIKSRREGKTVFYSLSDEHVKTIISQGNDHVMEVLKI